jgi:hypothetical protein
MIKRLIMSSGHPARREACAKLAVSSFFGICRVGLHTQFHVTVAVRLRVETVYIAQKHMF